MKPYDDIKQEFLTAYQAVKDAELHFSEHLAQGGYIK